MDSSGRGQAMSRNIIRNNIGIALSNLGEMKAAEPVLRKTVATFLRGNTEDFVHPAILINYCRTVLFLQRLDTAATWYEHLYTQSVERKDAMMESEGATGMARVELARGRANDAARWIDLARRADARRTPPQIDGVADTLLDFGVDRFEALARHQAHGDLRPERLRPADLLDHETPFV